MKKTAIIIGLLSATALGGVFLLGRPSESANVPANERYGQERTNYARNSL